MSATMAVAIFVATLAGACSRATDAPPPLRDGYAETEGVLRSIDLSRMPMDGDGVYVLIEDAGAVRTVHRASGEAGCDPRALEAPPDLAPGMRVRVRGRWEHGAIRVCDAGTRLQRVP